MDNNDVIIQLQKLLQSLDADGLMRLVQAFADEQRGKMKVV
jgi:hypothetical protein